ncbi:MAG: hypothetical protein ACRDPR_11020, partial [Nocardioidaceae bacterium]
MVLAAAPLALGLPAAGQASARTAPERAAVVLPLESGQGWYWDTRPEAIPCPEGAPAECNLIGDPAGRIAELFARDHLYVGWDSLQQAPEMITGLAFDLSPIDPGSRITRLRLAMLEHPQTTAPLPLAIPSAPPLIPPPISVLPPSLPELGHLTVNPSDAVVVACAWPDFFGGAPASPLTEAPPGRRCDANIAGVRSKEAVNPDAPPEGQVFRWTFDLSTFAAQWAGGVNPAISLEPDPSRPSGAPWITTFHAAAVRAPDGTPGIQAKVTWVPPADGGDVPISAGSGSTGGSGFGFPSAATDAPPAPAEPTVAVARQPRPTPSVAA